MNETTVLLAMVAVATAVLAFVVALPDPRRGRLVGEAEALVRFSATAAIAVLSTALLYAAEEITGALVATAVGDGMMVLAAWMTWAALAAVNGRTRLAPVLAVSAAVTSSVVSLLIPATPATAVKLVLVAAGCLAFGAESLVGRIRLTSGHGVFTGVGFGFGGYTLARVLVIALLGTDSMLYERAFTTVVSAFISGFAVISITIGVIWLYRQLLTRPGSTGTTPAVAVSLANQVLEQGRRVDTYSVEVAHFDLIRRAHGMSALQAVRAALVEAATSCAPSGVYALEPGGGRLAIVAAERRGAPSIAGDLSRAFDAALARSGFADLAAVDVARRLVGTPAELAGVFAPVKVETTGQDTTPTEDAPTPPDSPVADESPPARVGTLEDVRR